MKAQRLEIRGRPLFLSGYSKIDVAGTEETYPELLGKAIKTVRECPDEASTTGWGTPETICETPKDSLIEPNPAKFKYARWNGTKTIYYPQQ